MAFKCIPLCVTTLLGITLVTPLAQAEVITPDSAPAMFQEWDQVGFDPWRAVVRAQEEGDSIYDEPLATDRPDFTEASSVVGRGILQIEMGYTYIRDDEAGTRRRDHSFPETLFRYGISDNIELRLVWNYFWSTETVGGVGDTVDGAEDMILGSKFALTSQSGLLPESALILDFSTPTGGTGVTGQHVEFGSNYLFSWELPNDRGLGGSVGYSTGTEFTSVPPVVLEDRHNVFHSSVAYGIPLVGDWGAYFEYFGLYFDGLDGGGSENYFDMGMTYLLTNDIQFDVRVGAGLNAAADDFFAGTGLSIRL